MKVHKFYEYKDIQILLKDILYNTTNVIESDSFNIEYKSVVDKISSDLSIEIPSVLLNPIKYFYNVVEKILNNSGIECSDRTIILLLLASFSLIATEDRKIDSKILTKIFKNNRTILKEIDHSISPNASIGNSIILNNIMNIIKMLNEIISYVITNSNKEYNNLFDISKYDNTSYSITSSLCKYIEKNNLKIDNVVPSISSISLEISKSIIKNGLDNFKKEINSNNVKKIDNILLDKKEH